MTTKIDKKFFKPLNIEGKRSNSQIIVSYFLWKEGVDYCHEDLFEICEFDLPPRNALDLDFQTDVTSLMNIFNLLFCHICKYKN
mgnify:FL=1